MQPAQPSLSQRWLSILYKDAAAWWFNLICPIADGLHLLSQQVHLLAINLNFTWLNNLVLLGCHVTVVINRWTPRRSGELILLIVTISRIRTIVYVTSLINLMAGTGCLDPTLQFIFLSTLDDTLCVLSAFESTWHHSVQSTYNSLITK